MAFIKNNKAHFGQVGVRETEKRKKPLGSHYLDGTKFRPLS
jgi:hypothetical protein